MKRYEMKVASCRLMGRALWLLTAPWTLKVFSVQSAYALLAAPCSEFTFHGQIADVTSLIHPFGMAHFLGAFMTNSWVAISI